MWSRATAASVDEAEVVEYRDMVTIIRDRVADLDEEGTVAASRSKPRSRRATTTRDYGATSGYLDDG